MTRTQANAIPRPVIEVEHLWAGYESEAVLEDINLTVYERDFVGLIGPNGGGKTTLLKVLLGLLPPTRGRVRVMGQPVATGRKHIGYVPQQVEFDRHFPVSVWEVTRMGRLGRRGLLHRYTAEDDAVVERVLRQVEMLELRERPIGALSGGQRQRVYIARALATEPEILLLDEPTASVDPQVSRSIYDLFQEINARITILMISHDVGAISTYVKTVGCLNRQLFYHHEKSFSPATLEQAYQCPVELLAHGVPHRVFPVHEEKARER